MERLVLAGLLLLSGCATITEQPNAVKSLLKGQWGWSETDECTRNPHTISFSEDGRIMSIEYAAVGYVQSGEARKTFVYDVVAYNHNAVRAALREESRVDAQGQPVVWDLVPIDNNKYCWHRTDWAEGACTAPILRCEP
jgi:hypothetical protein